MKKTKRRTLTLTKETLIALQGGSASPDSVFNCTMGEGSNVRTCTEPLSTSCSGDVRCISSC